MQDPLLDCEEIFATSSQNIPLPNAHHCWRRQWNMPYFRVAPECDRSCAWR